MNISKRTIIFSLLVAVTAIGAGTAICFHHHNTAFKNNKNTAQTQKMHTNNKMGNASTNTTQAKDSSPINTTSPHNAACDALPLSAAQNIFGSSAQPAMPADLGIPQATDTTLTSCAYTARGNSIQLTLRSASSSLGASQNATMFGSERPANVISVQGYGQSAYWDPATSRLNVLSQNNWYITTGGRSTQMAAEATAKLIKGL